MGAVREMVSDGLYLAMIVHARGDMARVAAMLELWERRYRDGRAGAALLETGRGTAGHLAAVAARHDIAESTLRVHDRELRALVTAAMGEGLGAEVLLRRDEDGRRDATPTTPTGRHP